MSPNVYILLATYNGERYLARQLSSLLSQSEPNWKLLVMDDGSSDRTVAMVDAMARQDARISLESRALKRGHSALQVFGELLVRSFEQGADYVFCCDQDDVWHPEKVERVLACLKKLEGEAKIPALVHHDLEVVGQDLELINHSFWAMAGLKPGTEESPQRLISRNEVTGCALACNRSLLEIALPVPDTAIMHDWWLALCAAYFGRLRSMPEQFVRYRQHASNVIGAKSFWHGLNPLTNWRAGWHRGNQEFFETVRQAEAFRDQLGCRLRPEAESTVALDLYCALPTASRSTRLTALTKARVWRRQWLLDTVLALRMILLPVDKD